MKDRAPSKHAHCSKKTEKSENMIPVDMGNKYGLYLQDRYALPAQLHLAAFTAVNQEQAPPH